MREKSHKFDVFLPVMDETISLIRTIRIIENDCSKHISKYLIVVSKKLTTSESKNVIKLLKKKYKKKILVIVQKEKFIGGALKSAIKNIKSSHFILMASDLETNPKDVKKLIKQSIRNPSKIITANRWLLKNSFFGYNIIKLLFNKIFQLFFSALFFVKLSDLTFAFRVYPSNLIKKFNLKEMKHPILLETLLIPIKLEVQFIEISSKWRSRKEGKSNNTFIKNFLYIYTGFRIFFLKREKLIK